MNREILDALEEEIGLRYSRLDEAIHWYEMPTAWRPDFLALWNPVPIPDVKYPLKEHERQVKMAECEIMYEAAGMHGEQYETITGMPELREEW